MRRQPWCQLFDLIIQTIHRLILWTNQCYEIYTGLYIAIQEGHSIITPLAAILFKPSPGTRLRRAEEMVHVQGDELIKNGRALSRAR
jgi:hypothetical protein